MKKQKRWMKSVIETSKKETPALPFSRSARRAGGLTRRHATQPKARFA